MIDLTLDPSLLGLIPPVHAWAVQRAQERHTMLFGRATGETRLGGWVLAELVRLADLNLADSRDALIRLMAGGIPCVPCRGKGQIKSRLEEENPDPRDPICATCAGSGFAQKPVHAQPYRDVPGMQSKQSGYHLSGAQSAQLLRTTFHRWYAGVPLLAGVFGSWEHDSRLNRNYWKATLVVDPLSPRGICPDPFVTSAQQGIIPGSLGLGWTLNGYWGDRRGRETGEEGRACAENAVLALDYGWIRADGTIRLPPEPTP